MTNDFRLFTSIRVEDGRCALLPIHLNHMAASAAVLGFYIDRAALETAITDAAAQAGPVAVAKLRVTLANNGTWTLRGPEPLFADATNLQALLWPEPTDSHDSFYQHKTTHRPVYDRVVREVHGCGFVDAIFHNERGQVTEGAVHSIFARWGDAWKAPTLDAGVLPGVYREHLLTTMPAIREENFTVDDLLRADEVWLTNALRGIRKVTVVKQQRGTP